MTKALNLVSEVFGNLTVLSRESNDHRGGTRWLCVCSCGCTTVVRREHLKGGYTNSCGCIAKLGNHRIHNKTNTAEYRIWCGIKARVRNKTLLNYGGRGISICNSWLNSFDQFYRDMGDRPSVKHSIDRMDNDKNYCKSNCHWATAKEQANNRRNSIRIEYKGITMTIAQWSIDTGVKWSTLYGRIFKSKWSIEKSLTTKPRLRKV